MGISVREKWKERRLTLNRIRRWSLLIQLLPVASIRRKGFNLIKLFTIWVEYWNLVIFVWVLLLRSSVWVVFDNFLLIGATDKSKISSDHIELDSKLAFTPLVFREHNKNLVLTIHVKMDVYNYNNLSKNMTGRRNKPKLF